MSINVNDTLCAQTPVKDLIRERPRRAWVLENHGFDICASQAKPIADACAQYAVAPDALLAELRAHDAAAGAADKRDWNTVSLKDLINHILDTHHAFLRRALPRISKIQEHVAPRHGHQHPVLHKLLSPFNTLRADLEMHTLKEEQILFPMLIAIERGDDNHASHCGSVATLSM